MLNIEKELAKGIDSCFVLLYLAKYFFWEADQLKSKDSSNLKSGKAIYISVLMQQAFDEKKELYENNVFFKKDCECYKKYFEENPNSFTITQINQFADELKIYFTFPKEQFQRYTKRHLKKYLELHYWKKINIFQRMMVIDRGDKTFLGGDLHIIDSMYYYINEAIQKFERYLPGWYENMSLEF